MGPASFGGGSGNGRAKVEAALGCLCLPEEVEDRTELFDIVAEGLDLRRRGRAGDPHDVRDILRIDWRVLIAWTTRPRIDDPLDLDLDGLDRNIERRGLDEIGVVQAGCEPAEHQ